MEEFSAEINEGNRFRFGENWSRFLSVLNDDRIAASQHCLLEMTGQSDISGFKFLDAGCGSGLSSLAARRAGASVHSFDFDPASVACAVELRARYCPNDAEWTISEGSVLDRSMLTRLGKFDVVYSWGVLHHTGSMWLGIENLISAVKPGGLLFIAIYNDQGWKSRVWWLVKWLYNKMPKILRPFYTFGLGGCVAMANIVKHTVRLSPMTALRGLKDYQKSRGMSWSHDLTDWYGGFPFEFSSFDNLQLYFEARGFRLQKGKRAGSLGCHELVFRLI